MATYDVDSMRRYLATWKRRLKEQKPFGHWYSASRCQKMISEYKKRIMIESQKSESLYVCIFSGIRVEQIYIPDLGEEQYGLFTEGQRD